MNPLYLFPIAINVLGLAIAAFTFSKASPGNGFLLGFSLCALGSLLGFLVSTGALGPA